MWIVLYQCLWRLMWKPMDRSHKRLINTCATPQLCHVSWLSPCPAKCKPMPLMADAASVNGSNRSMRLDNLGLDWQSVSSALKNTPWGQAFKHLPQPIHASAFLNITCLCPGKPTLPMTFLGHRFKHFQHAMQRCGFIATYAVSILLILIVFFLIQN